MKALKRTMALMVLAGMVGLLFAATAVADAAPGAPCFEAEHAVLGPAPLPDETEMTTATACDAAAADLDLSTAWDRTARTPASVQWKLAIAFSPGSAERLQPATRRRSAPLARRG